MLGRDRIVELGGKWPQATSPTEATAQPPAGPSGLSNKFTVIRAERWTQADQAEAEAQLARCINIDCGSFAAFDKPHWRKFFSSLRKHFTVPSRRKLASSLLFNDFEAIKAQESEFRSSAKHFGVAIDGWTDIKGRSFAAVMLNYPLPLFHKSYNVTHEVEVEVALVSLLSDVRESVNLPREPPAEFLSLPAKERIQATRFFGLVTDSPSVMIAARGACLEKRIVEVAFGCAPHALNNLVSDVFKVYGGHVTECVSIVRAFKGKSSEKEARKVFGEKQKQFGSTKGLCFMTPTRWTSSAATLDALTANKVVIQNCLLDEALPSDAFADSTRASLTGEFWQTHEDILKITEAITAACVFVEADNSALSSHVAVFMWLSVTFMTCSLRKARHEDRKTLVMMVRRRLCGWELPSDRRSRIARSFHPCLALAFIIDPLHENLRDRAAKMFRSLRLGRHEWLEGAEAHGEHVNSVEDIGSMAMSCLQSDAARGDAAFGAELINSCTQLRQKAGPFRSGRVFDSIIATMHPLNAFTGSVEHEPISVIAKPLFTLPCASGGVERHFKSRSRVSRKERLRLGEEKADMQSRMSCNCLQLQRASSCLAGCRVSGLCKVLSASTDNAVEDENANVDDDDARTATEHDSDDAIETFAELSAL